MHYLDLRKPFMQLPHQILNYLSGIFYSFDRTTYTNLSKFFENLAHDSFNRCLYKDIDWDKLLVFIVTKLFFLNGGYLIIDEVVLLKPFCKFMEYIKYVFSPLYKKSYLGYILVVLCWSNGFVSLPIAFRIHGVDKNGRNKNALARDLLNYAKYHLKLEPIAILFDSYFSSKHNLRLCEEFGWIFCTQIKSNRKFNGKPANNRSFLPYWTAKGKVNGIKVVVARHGSKYFCSNDLTLGHQSIRRLYKKRWPIEEIFHFTKKIGIEHCQSRGLVAQKAHFTMCFIAYAILQKESILRNITDYKIKYELSFQRAKFNLSALNLLLG